MNVLITGAKGFAGRNLVENLKCIRDGKNRTRPDLNIDSIYEYDIDNSLPELDRFCSDCDFVFNLAGVNRPKDPKEFREGNFGFASTLLDTLKKHGKLCAELCDSGISSHCDCRTDLIRVAHHGAEFMDAEVFAIGRHPLLTIKNSPGAIQLDHHSDNSHGDSKDHQKEDGSGEIEDTLQNELSPFLIQHLPVWSNLWGSHEVRQVFPSLQHSIASFTTALSFSHRYATSSSLSSVCSGRVIRLW